MNGELRDAVRNFIANIYSTGIKWINIRQRRAGTSMVKLNGWTETSTKHNYRDTCNYSIVIHYLNNAYSRLATEQSVVRSVNSIRFSLNNSFKYVRYLFQDKCSILDFLELWHNARVVPHNSIKVGKSSAQRNVASPNQKSKEKRSRKRNSAASRFHFFRLKIMGVQWILLLKRYYALQEICIFSSLPLLSRGCNSV